MLLTLLLSLIVAAFPQAPGTAPLAPTAAPQAAASPADCLKAARDFTSKRQKELTPLTAEKMNQITAEKNAQEKECAAKFDAKTMGAADLIALAEVFGDMGDIPGSAALITRVKTLPGASKTDVGKAIALEINNGLREPKGEERNARLEKMSDQLDALGPAAFGQQLDVHSRLMGFYRGDDIDAGIIKHATWIIKASESFTPEQRVNRNYPGVVASAHIDMAQAWAGQGMTDKALALLRDGSVKWGSAPYGRMTLKEARFDEEIGRLELVGMPAAAIAAPAWLNGPANNTLEMSGHVTLLEFTAHWCGPCRESYPGINRLRAKYGPQGFRVAQATQLYGYFQSERNLSPEAEIARDKVYFEEHHIGDVPLAISNQVIRKMVDGKVEQVTPDDPNYLNYKVGGIPQIHLIDKKGKIRLIMVGYDDANEAQLAKMIESLLKEK